MGGKRRKHRDEYETICRSYFCDYCDQQPGNYCLTRTGHLAPYCHAARFKRAYVDGTLPVVRQPDGSFDWTDKAKKLLATLEHNERIAQEQVGENFHARLAKKVGKRHPSPNHDVYPLGHWESMQIGLVLKWVAEVAGDDRREMSEQEYDAHWGLIDPSYIDSVLHIFDAHGRVTIIRELEEQ